MPEWLQLLGMARYLADGFQVTDYETFAAVLAEGLAKTQILRGDIINGKILLANSSEQNLCEKICSYRGAKLDENRTSTPTNSTIMQSIGAVCRLVVISPAVSEPFCVIVLNDIETLNV